MAVTPGCEPSRAAQRPTLSPQPPALQVYQGSTKNLYIWNDMNEPSVFNGPEVGSAARLRERGAPRRCDLLPRLAAECARLQAAAPWRIPMPPPGCSLLPASS